MLHHGHRLVTGLMVALWLLVGAFSGAAANTETAPAIKVALVDMGRVNTEYAQLAQKRAELQQWFEQQQRYLEELETRYIYLSEQHFNDILEILRMPRPLSQAAATRRDELRAINDEKEARHLELQAKVERTAKEQDEFNQLQETVEQRFRQISAIRDNLQAQLQQRQADAQAEVIDAMESAIEAAATAGGYHLVLNRMFVLYGGEDITDAVLQRLNGSAPAAPANARPPGGEQ